METTILQYIYDLFVGNGVAIAAGAFVVGQIIKQVNLIDNKYIPLICGTIGAIVGPFLLDSSGILIAVIQGLLLGWAATGGVETVKQLKK